MSIMTKIFGQNASGENGLEAFGHNFQTYLINGRCCQKHRWEWMDYEEGIPSFVTSYKSLTAWGSVWAAVGGTVGYAFGDAALGASIVPGYWLINGSLTSLIRTHRETLNNNSSPRNPGH